MNPMVFRKRGLYEIQHQTRQIPSLQGQLLRSPRYGAPFGNTGRNGGLQGTVR